MNDTVKYIFNYTYHLLLIYAFLLSGWRWYKGSKVSAILAFAFLAGIITESLAKSVQQAFNDDPEKIRRLLYYLYIPIEYSLFAFYFYRTSKSKHINRAIVLSVLFYIPIAIIVSKAQFNAVQLPLSISNEFPFPSLVYNIEGVLLIIISITILFTAELRSGDKFSQHLFYWICLGLLIYHAGSYILNVFYGVIENKQSPLATGISRLLNNGLNIIMYTIFSVGLIYAKNDSE